MSRVFSDEELAQAGRITADVIGDALECGDAALAVTLVNRFQLELMTMFHSYTGWEKAIGACIVELSSQERLQAIMAQVEDYEIAPERNVQTKGVARQWVAELEDIVAEIERGNLEGQAPRAHAIREHALTIHDGVMSRVVAQLSHVYAEHTDDDLRWVFSQVMKPEAMDPDGKLPFREKVENIMTFTRCHLLPFTVTEDHEKVTFMPDPCPSGARLIRDGHYDAPRNNAVVKGPGPLTYGREDLPVYCCHEPAMELVSALKTGVPLFIVDPPEDVGISPCRVYVYKDPAQIPDQYYERLGLKKPEDLIAYQG
ncbi:MAG: hypothetical protein AB8C02_14145 [Halioglobus sp.]